MNDIKGRLFQGEIILWAVRWYCKYGISYWKLKAMLEEHGIEMDYTTLFRWVQHYAPKLQKRLKCYIKDAFHQSWRVNDDPAGVWGQSAQSIKRIQHLVLI